METMSRNNDVYWQWWWWVGVVPQCHNPHLVRDVKEKKIKEEKKGKRKKKTWNATMQIIKQQCNAHKTQGKTSIWMRAFSLHGETQNKNNHCVVHGATKFYTLNPYFFLLTLTWNLEPFLFWHLDKVSMFLSWGLIFMGWILALVKMYKPGFI